jgi:hypothetical protein
LFLIVVEKKVERCKIVELFNTKIWINRIEESISMGLFFIQAKPWSNYYNTRDTCYQWHVILQIDISIDTTEVLNTSSSYILSMISIEIYFHLSLIYPSSSISIQISLASSAGSFDSCMYGYRDSISAVVFVMPGMYLISVSNYTRTSFQRIYYGDRSRCIFQWINGVWSMRISNRVSVRMDCHFLRQSIIANISLSYMG